MEKLKLSSRGNSTPHLATRLYVTAHPADAPSAIPLVTADILGVADVLVWSATEPLTAEELEDLLSGVNAVVLPISRRYLTERSYARDVEIRAALSRSVPVLPIILEEGLTDLFNEEFENRQFLDRTDRDITSIGYLQKLKAFFGGMATSDISRYRVMMEFDSKIFLSYRKKDRLHARELMHIIHDMPFCRDVAIWYDEYLTPGEDFNEEIKGAIDDCSAFVMAVTPNLVNESNYVNEHEYPMAHSLGKPIVAAECIKTDLALLRERYEDIPAPISPKDVCTLSLALRRALGERVNTENDHSPEHLYYVGLAYLRGIGVELDYTRAVSLITEAAEAKFLTAMRRLATMYSIGEGVEYDFTRAYDIRVEVMRICEARFDRNNITRDDYEYFDILALICDMLLEYGACSDYRNVFDRMLLVASLIDEAFCDDASSFTLGMAYKQYGNFLVAIGEPSEAEKYYLSAVTCLKNGYLLEDDEETLTAYLEACIAISNCRRERGDHWGALRQIEEGISLINRMDEERILNYHLVAKTYYALAEIYYDLDKYKDALPHYERVNSLIDQVRANNSAMTAIYDKINVCLDLADCYNAYKRRGDSDAAYAEASRLVTELGDSLHSSWKYHVRLRGVGISISRFKLKSARRELDRISLEILELYGDGDDFGLIGFVHDLYANLNTYAFRMTEADKYNVMLLREKTERVAKTKTTSAYLSLGRTYTAISRLFNFRRKREWQGFAVLAKRRELEFFEDSYAGAQLELLAEDNRDSFKSMRILFMITMLLSIPALIVGRLLGVTGMEALFVSPLVAVWLGVPHLAVYRIIKEQFEGGFDPVAAMVKVSTLKKRLSLLILLISTLSFAVFFLLNRIFGGSAGSPVTHEVVTPIMNMLASIGTQGLICALISSYGTLDLARHELFKYAGRLFFLGNYVPPRRDKDFWE